MIINTLNNGKNNNIPQLFLRQLYYKYINHAAANHGPPGGWASPMNQWKINSTTKEVVSCYCTASFPSGTYHLYDKTQATDKSFLSGVYFIPSLGGFSFHPGNFLSGTFFIPSWILFHFFLAISLFPACYFFHSLPATFSLPACYFFIPSQQFFSFYAWHFFIPC